MWGMQSGLALVLLHALAGFVVATAENVDPERPYYIRPSPAILLTQPQDGTLNTAESITLTCEVKGMEPIISGWWPHIYWHHNDSIVNSTWPGNITIATNYWNVTTLHTPFPGTYQCVVDDGSFILASRLATVKEGCIGEFASPLWKVEFSMVCGQSAPPYSWYKDGIPLTEKKERIVVVTNETRDPFGLYTCITSGVIRQWYLPELASGENTTVLIDGNPSGNDVFVHHSGSGMTEEDITLQCNITVPGSAVNITWLHNGKQNHGLSTDSIHFPRNSHVSAIAGTYVCTASTSNWEARVQFRILLKNKPNPADSVYSSCVEKYPEINAQNLKLTWTRPRWRDLVTELDIYSASNSYQMLVISRHNNPNERYYHIMAPNIEMKLQTLRLDSEYCITLFAAARRKKDIDISSEPYYLSEGNSTLHHCNSAILSCPRLQIETQYQDFSLTSDDALSVSCGDLQNDEEFECSFLWQNPTPLRPSSAHFTVLCPDGYSNQQSLKILRQNTFDRVVSPSVKFSAFNCTFECQVEMCINRAGCQNPWIGNLLPHSRKLQEPIITCTNFRGVSSISIMTPEYDRILQCIQSNTNNNNSNIPVTLFVNEGQFSYSTQLNETLVIPITNFTNGSEANENITVIAMYSNTMTGTSKNSSAINIPDTCTCVTGWSGSQCDEAVCTLPCMNGGTCSKPDTCTCVTGWKGSQCHEDIDECSQSICEQLCNNTAGSFECNCYPDFTLDANRLTCSASLNNDIAILSAASGGLLALILAIIVTGLCLCYRCKRCSVSEPPIYFEPDNFIELASVAECDVPTVCDDIAEDIDKWIQDVIQDEDPVKPMASNGTYPGYIIT